MKISLKLLSLVVCLFRRVGLTKVCLACAPQPCLDLKWSCIDLYPECCPYCPPVVYKVTAKLAV